MLKNQSTFYSLLLVEKIHVRLGVSTKLFLSIAAHAPVFVPAFLKIIKMSVHTKHVVD